MHAPTSIQVQPAIPLPGDSPQIRDLKSKLNEVIRKFDEVYRLLRADVMIMDFRQLPPHAGIDHASWKFYENPTTGDLEIWHRTDAVWAKTYWDILGDKTRRPTV